MAAGRGSLDVRVEEWMFSCETRRVNMREGTSPAAGCDATTRGTQYSAQTCIQRYSITTIRSSPSRPSTQSAAAPSPHDPQPVLLQPSVLAECSAVAEA